MLVENQPVEAEHARLEARREDGLHQGLARLEVLAGDGRRARARELLQGGEVHREVGRAVGVGHALHDAGVGVDGARGDVGVVVAQALLEGLEGLVDRRRLAPGLGRAAPHGDAAVDVALALEAGDVLHELLGEVHLRRAGLHVGGREALDVGGSNTAFIGWMLLEEVLHGLEVLAWRARRPSWRRCRRRRGRGPTRRTRGSSSGARGTKSLMCGALLSVRLPSRMVPICVSEPMGLPGPLRMSITPAMVVVDTAPRPGSRMPSFTGLPIDPYFSATKLAWLLDHVPGARERAARGELAAGTLDTFTLFRLSQGRVFATEPSTACRTPARGAGNWPFFPAFVRSFRCPLGAAPGGRGQRRGPRCRAHRWPRPAPARPALRPTLGPARRRLRGSGRREVHLRHGGVPAGPHRGAPRASFQGRRPAPQHCVGAQWTARLPARGQRARRRGRAHVAAKPRHPRPRERHRRSPRSSPRRERRALRAHADGPGRPALGSETPAGRSSACTAA
jgi:hypothetical protein